MLTRIVKMTFQPSATGQFLEIFKESMEHIRAMEGCSYLELFSDTHKANVFFTYSRWDSPAHLEAYRNSELFRRTWSRTKALFSEKAEAWSLNSEFRLN